MLAENHCLPLRLLHLIVFCKAQLPQSHVSVASSLHDISHARHTHMLWGIALQPIRAPRFATVLGTTLSWGISSNGRYVQHLPATKPVLLVTFPAYTSIHPFVLGLDASGQILFDRLLILFQIQDAHLR